MSQTNQRTMASLYKKKDSAADVVRPREPAVARPNEFELVSFTDMFELLYVEGRSPPITITDTLFFKQGRLA